MPSKPPTTPVEPVVDTIHGVPVVDLFRWLEDGESERVREWVAGQQVHARSVLDSYARRPAVAKRLLEAFSCGMLGPSAPRGPRRFFTRRTGAMEQPALYVVENDQERLLVDPTSLGVDVTSALDWWFPSADGEMLAVGISASGDEQSTLCLVRVADGRVLEERIPNCQWCSVAFEPGNGALLYTRFPAGAYYEQRAWRHVVGTPVTSDEMVFGEGNGRTDTINGMSISASGRLRAVNVHRGWDESSLFLSVDGRPYEEVFTGRGETIGAWFSGERLLAHTNAGAPNWRVVEIDPARPARDSWRDLVPESSAVLVDAATTTDRLLVHHLVNACSNVSVHSLDGTFEGLIDLPPLATVTGLGAHSSSGDAFLTVETFTRPAFLLCLDPATGRYEESGHLDPPPLFDATNFPVRQLKFASPDGTESYMFLVGRQTGEGPTVLTGYGGFNLPKTPLWTPSIVPFLEAGGLFVVATLRGGSEYGEEWHRAGMRDKKQNVFDDFIAAAEQLIAERLATPSTLGITGGSNGGLLVGAAMTQRPDLFGAVVCRVPLLDMVRYERFRIAELWNREYGSVKDADAFEWLHAYSPYHRAREGVRYPPLLLTTGEADARVDPMHARKMAALLQTLDPDGLTLIRVEPNAGHGQGKPVAKLVPEEADVWTFLLENLR